MHTLDTVSFLNTALALLDEGKTDIPVPVAGSSMTPFLRPQDTVYLSRIEAPIRRGDILLYRRASGQYVLHRVRRVRENTLDMIGDAQTETEHGVPHEAVCAIVRKVKRGNTLLTPDSPLWRFYQRAWLSVIPLRPTAVKVREALRKRK